MPDRRRPRWTPGDIVLTTVVLATTLFLFINVGLFSAVTSPPASLHEIGEAAAESASDRQRTHYTSDGRGPLHRHPHPRRRRRRRCLPVLIGSVPRTTVPPDRYALDTIQSTLAMSDDDDDDDDDDEASITAENTASVSGVCMRVTVAKLRPRRHDYLARSSLPASVNILEVEPINPEVNVDVTARRTRLGRRPNAAVLLQQTYDFAAMLRAWHDSGLCRAAAAAAGGSGGGGGGSSRTTNSRKLTNQDDEHEGGSETDFFLLLEDDFTWCPQAKTLFRSALDYAHTLDRQLGDAFQGVRVAAGLSGLILRCRDVPTLLGAILVSKKHEPLDYLLASHWSHSRPPAAFSAKPAKSAKDSSSSSVQPSLSTPQHPSVAPEGAPWYGADDGAHGIHTFYKVLILHRGTVTSTGHMNKVDIPVCGEVPCGHSSIPPSEWFAPKCLAKAFSPCSASTPRVAAKSRPSSASRLRNGLDGNIADGVHGIDDAKGFTPILGDVHSRLPQTPTRTVHCRLHRSSIIVFIILRSSSRSSRSSSRTRKWMPMRPAPRTPR